MTDIVSRLRNWRTLHLTLLGELFEAAADEIERLRNGAVEGCETVPLTAEERAAIATAIVYLQEDDDYPGIAKDKATLCKLLERLK